MRLSDDKYEELKQEVADLLETYSVKKYPINLRKLIDKMGVHLIKYSSLDDVARRAARCKSDDSFNTWLGNESFILFNDEKSNVRIRYNLAHEIAHVWCEHREESEENEAEANFFAGYLLAPVPLVIKYEINRPEEISCSFKVSQEAGFNAFNRAFKRYRTGLCQTAYEYAIVNLCSLEGK